MSDEATVLGLPAEWRFGGQTWKVWASDYEIRGLFCRWVQRQALLAIEGNREALGVAGYALQMDSWQKNCATGVYGYSGLEGWQARQSEEGRKELLALRLSKGQPQMQLDELRMLVWEAYEEDEEAFRALEAAAQAADADPNRPRPWRRAGKS